MLKESLFAFIFFSCIASLNAQIVSGQFTNETNAEIRLDGFNGLNTYPISTTTTDENGHFQLSFSQTDYGMGYLISSDNQPLYIILSKEDVAVTGKALIETESIKITEGTENQYFEQYANQHPRRVQALNAWIYLERKYYSDPLFSDKEAPKTAITEEIRRIETEDTTFLAHLPEGSYVKWFLPVRKLVSSASILPQHRPEEIPATIRELRNLDYTDPRIYKSGLLKETIESHFCLIENSGKPLDSVYVEMQTSIDVMINALIVDVEKLNEITEYLFDYLERRSLFIASEYLALKLLNEERCTINNDLANQLETYRAMSTGKIAPDFTFAEETSLPGYDPKTAPEKLSDINSKYTVVVFGASWCPKCTTELPEITNHYPKWKEYGVEVVFVSLDETPEVFQNFTEDFPFISTCDYQKWDGPIVKDYYVFATPTIYLLDQVREILLRPNSVQHLDTWVDWFLVEGNFKK